jgi:hypothetical protein
MVKSLLKTAWQLLRKQNKSCYYYYYFVVLGFELKAFTLSHSISPFFCEGFFNTGFLELFAWDGIKL